MAIRNDSSNLFFFAYLAGRQMADDRCTGNSSFPHLLCRFLPVTGAIADIHIFNL
jgi:hypothetical protein